MGVNPNDYEDVFSFPDGGAAITLPQTPGYYIAYAFDLEYMALYSAQVLKDPPGHVEWLRKERADSDGHYIYTADSGDVLTMYFEGDTGGAAGTHQVPPRWGDDRRPAVCGYVRYDFGHRRKSR